MKKPGLLLVIMGVLGTSLAVKADLIRPLSRAVFQRNDQNTAQVPIQGTYSGEAARIDARAVVMAGFQGMPVEWQVIDASPSGGSFSSTLSVPAGGWYRIEVRILNSEGVVISVMGVDRIGVGEVFITAGQSNSANHGSPAKTPAHDIVSAWTGSGWRHAYDPQPIATGTGGSPWPRLADMLIDELEVPIGFVSVGVGGTRVDQWVPSANLYYPRIRDAILAVGPNGMRAILWHQGESDADNATDTATYAARLRKVIGQSRVDAGFQVPWGIALASWMPPQYNQQEEWRLAVREGQLQVIGGDPCNFQGPDTDVWTGSTYRWDTIHFNAIGLQLHALGWKSAILKRMQPWDFNQDQGVNTADFSVLASAWLESRLHLAARWEMEEGAGITAADSSGNGWDGTLIGGPAWTSGKLGRGLSFDGIDDQVQISGYKGVTGSGARTCAFWIKTTDANGDILSWGRMESNGQIVSGEKWVIDLTNGYLYTRVQGGNIRWDNTSVCDGQWHHVAVSIADDGTMDISEAVCYMDGIPQRVLSTIPYPVKTAEGYDVMLGRFIDHGTEATFTGLLDDVRIYEAALSAEQIIEIIKPVSDFNRDGNTDIADLSEFTSYWLENDSLEAKWELNETAGLTAADSSGHGWDGTLIGGPAWTVGKFGGGLFFDGIDDYVQFLGYNGLNGCTPRTCAFWIKTTDLDGVILSWGRMYNENSQVVSGEKWIIDLTNGSLCIRVQGGNIIYDNPVIHDGQWHHIAVTLDNDGSMDISEAKYYLDGIQQPVYSTNPCQVYTAAAYDVMFGYFAEDASGLLFSGQLDDVRIYDVALTAEQISDIAAGNR